MTTGQPSAPSLQIGNQVKRFRKQRGWSLEELARVSGISRSMLSQIERNETNPTVVVALATAKALGVTLEELVTPPGEGSPLQVIRGDDTQYVYQSDESRRIRTLSPLSPERELEFYEIELPPGGDLRSAPHFASTREYLTVYAGKVRVESGSHSVDLAAGDSVTYPADVPHAILNIDSSLAIVFLIDTVPKR